LFSGNPSRAEGIFICICAGDNATHVIRPDTIVLVRNAGDAYLADLRGLPGHAPNPRSPQPSGRRRPKGIRHPSIRFRSRAQQPLCPSRKGSLSPGRRPQVDLFLSLKQFGAILWKPIRNTCIATRRSWVRASSKCTRRCKDRTISSLRPLRPCCASPARTGADHLRPQQDSLRQLALSASSASAAPARR
jgi:hypothetical protein